MERYDPRHGPLAHLPELRPGDVGMHLLVAPTDTPVPGFTSAVMRRVMRGCFADPSVRRVVVEPDVRNEQIARPQRRRRLPRRPPVELPDKRAALELLHPGRPSRPRSTSTLTSLTRRAPHPRHHGRRPASPGRQGDRRVQPRAAAHADRARRRRLAARGRRHDVRLHGAAARPRALGDRRVVPDPDGARRAAPSSTRRSSSSSSPDVLGIPDALLPTYLEEIASTLASSAWKLAHHQLIAADLVARDYQEIEAAMTEGHPAFVANNGRIGFSADDFAAYAPETGADVRLSGWPYAAARPTSRCSTT